MELNDDDLTDVSRSGDAISRVEHAFGPGARLHSIDHEFATLLAVEGDAERVPLTGQFRDALIAKRTFVDDDVRWIPLSDADHPMFAIRVPASSSVETPMSSLYGPFLNGVRMRLEDIEKRRRRRDMTVGADLQWRQLPVRATKLDGCDVAGILEPAYEVAGDMYDYALCDGSVWAYSFDGMGHGLDATIMSTIAVGSVRNARLRGLSLLDQMAFANDTLFERYGGDCFVTAAGCQITPTSVTIVNAGHEPVRTVRSGEVVQLELHADLPLGLEPGAARTVHELSGFDVGDGLVMFSDGLSDARSESDGVYGSDRLDAVLASTWSDTPLRTGHDTIDSVLGFLDESRLGDDMTAVVVRRREESVR